MDTQLNEILGSELFEQVKTKLGDKKLILDDGKIIPKHRFDEINDALKSQKELVKSYDEKVKNLESLANGNEDLKKSIQTLQTQIAEKQAEFSAMEIKTRKSFAVKEALLNSGVADAEARELLAMKFDVEKIELDEIGRVKGFDDLVKPLKDNATLKNLFGQTFVAGQEHQRGNNPDLGEYAGENNPFRRGGKAYNLTKQLELKKADPDLAKRLMESAK